MVLTMSQIIILEEIDAFDLKSSFGKTHQMFPDSDHISHDLGIILTFFQENFFRHLEVF